MTDVRVQNKLRTSADRGSLRECGFVDSTRGVTGRSDNRAMGLAKEDQRETNRQDSSDAVGTSPIEG